MYTHIQVFVYCVLGATIAYSVMLLFLVIYLCTPPA